MKSSIIFERLEPSKKSATGYAVVLRDGPTGVEEFIEVNWKVGKALMHAEYKAAEAVRATIRQALGV